MKLSLAMITFDTLAPMPIATWWAEQMGGQVIQENGGFFPVVSLGDGSPLLAFQQVEDPTPGKNRAHLDLIADDRDAAVLRLVEAGATKIGQREMEGFSWVTLSDPDGNQFCVAGPDHP